MFATFYWHTVTWKKNSWIIRSLVINSLSLLLICSLINFNCDRCSEFFSLLLFKVMKVQLCFCAQFTNSFTTCLFFHLTDRLYRLYNIYEKFRLSCQNCNRCIWLHIAYIINSVIFKITIVYNDKDKNRFDGINISWHLPYSFLRASILVFLTLHH